MLDPILTDRLPFYPNTCLDGSQGKPGEPVVDTHHEVEGYGQTHVYLSKRQVVTYARLYGMVPSAEHVKLAEERDTLVIRVRELETELAEARPILAAIGRAHSRFGVDD